MRGNAAEVTDWYLAVKKAKITTFWHQFTIVSRKLPSFSPDLLYQIQHFISPFLQIRIFWSRNLLNLFRLKLHMRFCNYK